MLYHTDSAGESPFDVAILRVVQSGPVRIVSPYIGVTYLERIINIAPEWRLLSDVEEWLRSLSTRDRPKAWQFIRENLELAVPAKRTARFKAGQELLQGG